MPIFEIFGLILYLHPAVRIFYFFSVSFVLKNYIGAPELNPFTCGKQQFWSMLLIQQINMNVVALGVTLYVQTSKPEMFIFLSLGILVFFLVFDFRYICNLGQMNFKFINDNRYKGVMLLLALVPFQIGLGLLLTYACQNANSLAALIAVLLSLNRIMLIKDTLVTKHQPIMPCLYLTYEFNNIMLILYYMAHFHFNTILAIVLLGLTGLQVIILTVCQCYLKPKSIRPALNRLPRNDYFKVIQKASDMNDSPMLQNMSDMESQEHVCSICLQQIFRFDGQSMAEQSVTLNSPSNLVIVKEHGCIIETKCKHYFHQPCLYSWIALNAMCPLCKALIRDE